MEARIDRDDDGQPLAVWLSASTGAGIELLEQAIAERLGTSMISGRLLLPPDQGRVRSMLYQQHAVAAETHRDDGASELDVRLPHHDWMRILSAGDLSPDQLHWLS